MITEKMLNGEATIDEIRKLPHEEFKELIFERAKQACPEESEKRIKEVIAELEADSKESQKLCTLGELIWNISMFI